MSRLTRSGGILISMALLCAGCSSGTSAKLTIRSSDPQTLYAQDFDQAYVTQSTDGEYDIILLQDSIDRSKPIKSSSQPLNPVRESDFRQVVHIHVFWQAASGHQAKDGAVTNATIAWYVLRSNENNRPEMVRYQGAGHVLLSEGKKTVAVEIRDGLMRRTEIRGTLTDPLGPSQLAGKITAQRNAPAVQELIAELKTRNAEQPAITDIR